MDQYQTPGVYLREIFPVPAAGLPTGVPAFLGYAAAGPIASETALGQAPQVLRLGAEFEALFGAPLQNSYLASAVRGYFENDGRLCYVVRLDDTLDAVAALRLGLEALRPLDSIDLICAPDIMRSPAGGASPPNPDTVYALQKAVLEHCDAAGDRFAILDSLPLVSGSVVDQRQGLQGNNGALYYPWVGVAAGASLAGGLVPPCGHVAGVYTRSDQRVGVHKAPANEILKGVLDLEV